jgi:prepilin-type processing-associated H-X9-DG protein
MQTKTKASCFFLSVICLFVSLPARAADTPAKLYQAVRPCIDDQTFAVIHLDLRKLDIDALVGYAVGQMSEHAGADAARHIEDDLNDFRTVAGEKLDSLAKAGGRDVFVVFSMYDIPYFFVAVPIPQGANQAALYKQVQNIAGDFKLHGGEIETQVSGRLVLLGFKRTIARLKTAGNVPAPVLDKALQACAGKTLKVMLFPSSDQRRILGEMMPTIPTASGALYPTTIGQDMNWMALGLDGPPAISLNLTIQSGSADGADRVLTLVEALYAMAKKHNKDNTGRPVVPDLDRLLERLTPRRQGDQLRLDINSEAAKSLMEDVVAPSLARVHATATRMACGTNMSGIGKALLIYANDYNDEMPPDLETLIHKAEMPPKGLICPATGKRESYVYRGAGLTTSAIPMMVTVYETAANHGEDGRNVLFLDTHVEWVTEERFQELIKADNEYRRKKGLPVLPAR